MNNVRHAWLWLSLITFLVSGCLVMSSSEPITTLPTRMPLLSLTAPASPSPIATLPPPATITAIPTAPLPTTTLPPTETAVGDVTPPPTLSPTAGDAASATPLILATAVGSATPQPTLAPATITLTTTPIPYYQVSIIGYSTQGRAIENHQFGLGNTHIILVGGIHGGYEWNSTLLAYNLIDHFWANQADVPPNVTLSIIPVANPDGLALVTGHDGRFLPTEVISDTYAGRFNGRGVDLNRNWPCNWQSTATWRDEPVDPGPFPLSETENIVLRDFLLPRAPAIVIFYHSAYDAIFISGCPDALPASLEQANRYATAAGYPVYTEFTSYPITGDVGDWLSTQGIPSFTVELSTHQSLDWNANRAGLLALLAGYR